MTALGSLLVGGPHQPIAAYFGELQKTCAHALSAQGRTVQRMLAGRTVQYHVAGEALFGVMQQAVDHLPEVDESAADFTIFVWDEAATGVARPIAPWVWPDATQAVELTLPAGAEDFFPLYDSVRQIFGLYQQSTRTAVVCVPDAARLPTPWHGAPLFRMFHWWSQSVGLALLHAACVGTDDGAVLLVGKGGSGKSTTSLLCLAAGLRYVSDDYCLLEPSADRPRAHCLYNTGKLHRDHITRFPSLAQCAVDVAGDVYDKKLIFASQHFPQQLARSLPLRAVFLPCIVGGDSHRLVPTSPGEALRALAPSTLFQVSGHGPRHLQTMGALVRQLPAYRLELGTDFASIPAMIETFLCRG
jgi:hypothetical protein